MLSWFKTNITTALDWSKLFYIVFFRVHWAHLQPCIWSRLASSPNGWQTPKLSSKGEPQSHCCPRHNLTSSWTLHTSSSEMQNYWKDTSQTHHFLQYTSCLGRSCLALWEERMMGGGHMIHWWQLPATLGSSWWSLSRNTPCICHSLSSLSWCKTLDVLDFCNKETLNSLLYQFTLKDFRHKWKRNLWPCNSKQGQCDKVTHYEGIQKCCKTNSSASALLQLGQLKQNIIWSLSIQSAKNKTLIYSFSKKLFTQNVGST